MRRWTFAFAAAFGLLALPAATYAQQGGSALACEPTATGEELAGRASPYDSISIQIGNALAKICYSRPSLRGRTMIGGEAVPYGTLWRTGANEPTIIHIPFAAEIAGIAVEPGEYSIYTIPREGDNWTLIVNASTSQWGRRNYYTAEVEAREVGRASVPTERIQELIETMTFRTAESGDATTDLILEWQHTRVRIPITRRES